MAKITAIRCESYEGQFTGKVSIKLDATFEGFIRDVDEDGVITFSKGTTDTIRVDVKYLMAVLRNETGDACGAIGFYLDFIKDKPFAQRAAIWSALLRDADVDVVAELHEADADAEHDFFEYKLSNIVLQKKMLRMVTIVHYQQMMSIDATAAAAMADADLA